MDEEEQQARTDMIECAYAAGQLADQEQDWMLIVANLAIGYRDSVVATDEAGAPPPAYTGSSQITSVGAVGSEPNSGAAQGPPAPVGSRHYEALITALVAMSEQVAGMMDEAARDARREGVTWAELGTWLKLGKSAAHKRYGRPSDMGDDTPRAV